MIIKNLSAAGFSNGALQIVRQASIQSRLSNCYFHLDQYQPLQSIDIMLIDLDSHITAKKWADMFVSKACPTPIYFSSDVAYAHDFDMNLMLSTSQPHLTARVIEKPFKWSRLLTVLNQVIGSNNFYHANNDAEKVLNAKTRNFKVATHLLANKPSQMQILDQA